MAYLCVDTTLKTIFQTGCKNIIKMILVIWSGKMHLCFGQGPGHMMYQSSKYKSMS